MLFLLLLVEGNNTETSLVAQDVDGDISMTSASLAKLQVTPLSFAAHYKLEMLNSSLYERGTRDASIPARLIDRTTGLYVDVFAFDELDVVGAAFLVARPSSLWSMCVRCERADVDAKFPMLRRDWVLPVSRSCRLAGRRLPCPRNARSVLQYVYGDSYMTPIEYF